MRLYFHNLWLALGGRLSQRCETIVIRADIEQAERAIDSLTVKVKALRLEIVRARQLAQTLDRFAFSGEEEAG